MPDENTPQRLPYRYFVAYSHTDRYGFGFGSIEIGLAKPVAEIEDVAAMKDVIAEVNPGKTIVVTNFILLSGPATAAAQGPTPLGREVYALYRRIRDGEDAGGGWGADELTDALYDFFRAIGLAPEGTVTPAP